MDRRRGRIYLWRCACRCAGRVRWLADGNGQTGRHTWQWSSRGGGVLQPGARDSQLSLSKQGAGASGSQPDGDSANIALRPNGSVYFQHAWNTASPADLAAVGNIHASGNVNAVGNIQTNGSMRAQGNVQAENAGIRGDTATGGWFKTLGDGGWYNQKWQGGWMMNDPIWLRSIADKNIYTGGMVQGGAVHTNGRL